MQILHTKTPLEITEIKKVQLATEEAMRAVIDYLSSTPNPSSEEARKIIELTLAKHNCESPEGSIVAAGTKSSEPHYEGEGTIEKGVPIVIDIFPRSKDSGFFADMSRTVCVGKATPELKKIYDTVLAAQKLAITMIRPGVKCSVIHLAVENYFVQAGYKTSGIGKEFPFARGFVHSLGHGVGKKIHERPVLSPKSEDVLVEGQVITIEPGLYFDEIGGVRIEDMLVVTKNGSENLTHFPHFFEI